MTINLRDEGSGISKVSGLLFFIWENVQYKSKSDYIPLLIMEEPESNLHPSIQSKLADLFVEIVNKHKVKLVIETHSEYLIRKLQYLVATKKINHENIGVHYFSMDKNDAGRRQIEFYEIPIEKDGRLSKGFGAGFFDEADNLAIKLFLMNKNKEN